MPESLAFDQVTLAPLVAYAAQLGLNALGALAILVFGLVGAGWVRRLTARALRRAPRMDNMVADFLAGVARYIVIVLVVVAVLSQFGVQTTSLAALIAGAGLAIGLALQGTLSHVAAGVMLLLVRPFQVGQFIEIAGHSGTVKNLSLFKTELATSDNVQVIIPNGAVWGSSIVNYSAHPTRRVVLTVGISYTDDIDKAIEALRAEIEAEPRCMTNPAPQVLVDRLAESSVDLVLRVWTSNDNYGAVKADLTKAIKERFDEEGITIPFPTRTVVTAAAG